MARYAQAIQQLIDDSQEHLTAEQIHQRLKGTSSRPALATVYNNLNQLCAEGRIRRISVEGYPDRYDRVARHDHLICRRCQGLSDINLPDLRPMLQQQVPQRILAYDLKIQVLCPACQKALDQDLDAAEPTDRPSE